MEYRFAASRKISFIVQADGRNWLVQFDDPNQAGVCGFMTTNPKIANAVRKHFMSRQGVIKETTPESEAVAEEVASTAPVTQETGESASDAAPDADDTTEAEEPDADATGEAVTEPGTTDGQLLDEREYDNYTVAREALCKEFGVNKNTVRNPETLSQLAKEHGIIIRYKEL